MADFEGKVAIVTGAASPIGRSIASRLHASGMQLMLTDVDETGLNEVVNQLKGSASWAGDLSDESVVRSMVAATLERYGEIDVLVNNAGGGVIRPFLEHDASSLVTTLNRNLWSTLWCCHAALPSMVDAGYGRIVNIGADSVRNGLWEHAAYNAAKGGVHGLTTGLAREFARSGITVNTVAPCMVATPAVREAMAAGHELVERFAGVIPMGRPAETSEVASMVAYLASDEAAFVTGQVVSVNGGSTML